ncbi:hypothetical protein [Neobacillus sp. OS1-33]|uniref:hypothetical protein n=1 Tax=Neobacillus sp. OS1-33 TaxID=3070683 RepID=UPI0027E1EED0|nr:hypothetical protein [Neobacillus sp. OS1-33]WML26436.1 hypothetical protein RCG22_01980 [Neobacillus sp. OS1-33]
MPRIEKVRITGVRYDKMKKHYENTIFDFMNDSDPEHALLTLVNGGGKGMLLQIIFQALIPLTTWGKNGENQIDALFYNEKQQFDPYTFHVALEWRLDTDPAEWLVTGICVTARKFGQENEEIETEPQYFLYTSKYRKPEDWTIDTLPLYDEENKRTAPFEDWENWLKRHKQQFHIYSKSKQTAYFQYLSSYGIEKAEWRQMKEINRDEGGIEHYFKKGLDNFGLFHHLIIPEISAYLQEDQEENLVKIFRDNSIIAQKLPKLLKREDAYQLIQGKLVPIKATLEEGQVLETKVQEHHDRANYLYAGMEEQKQTNHYEQDKWEEDKRKSEQLQADFLWQKDNLDYAKECRSYDEISRDIEFSQSKVQQLDETKLNYESEKHDMEVTIALTDYNESTEKLKSIESRIIFLEDAQNLQEEKAQSEKIEQQLTNSWKAIETELRDDIEKFNTLQNRLNKNLNGLHSQINFSQQELNDVRSQLGTYTAYIKAHHQKAITMEQKYGRDINREPELVQRKVTKELQELNEASIRLQKESEELHSRKVEVSKQLGECGAVIKGKKSELLQAAKEIAERLGAERAFHKRWSRYYFLEQEFQSFSANDWIDISEQINKEKDQLRFQFDNIQKEYWYHQLDTALVNDDYWVPNNDVRKMVEKLAEDGVQASYGTRLIQELNPEEQALVMERYPLLAYGIVIHQQDWDKKVDESRFQQMLAHAPVPIFIRERMDQPYAQPFEIARNQGIAMAFHKELWLDWKDNLSKLTDNFTTDLGKVETKLDEVEHLLEIIKGLAVTTYEEILNAEESIKRQLAELNEQQSQLHEEMNLVDGQLAELAKLTITNNQELKEAQKKLHEIESWVNDYKQYKQYQLLKSETQMKETQIQKRLGEFTQQRDELQQNLSSWVRSFQIWEISTQQQTELIKEILPTIQYPMSDHVLTNEGVTPQLRKVIFDEVGSMVKHWHNLQQKINSVNSELASERTNRDHQIKDQQLKKSHLEQLESNWIEREVSKFPREILQEQLRLKNEEILQTKKALSSERGRAQGLQGQIVQIEKNKLKLEQQIFKKHHLAVESWANVNLEEKEIEIDELLKKVSEDLAAQQKIIGELIRQQQLLQKQQDILKTHQVSFKQVGEIPPDYKEKIKNEPEKLIQHWIGQNNDFNQRKEQYHKGFKERLKELSFVLQDEKMDTPLKQSMNHLIPQLESDSIRSGLSVISSVIEHIQHELLKLKYDKQKAENAQEIWVDRAVIRVIRIFQSLKQMVNRMKIKNKEGHSFPLVEIERLKEIETGDEEEYRRLLREHFIQTIEKLLDSEEAIENLTDAQLKKYIDDNQLVLISLRNRYPKLQIYKPQTTNAFLYEKPRKHHFTDWETLNKGSKMEAKGSGGQLLAARTMIMMMIMTFKRQEHNNNWSVLITDNPFGQAVSAHILDPIFSIADILRFQWIVLAPPELIKLDVSRRFPVYWKLELSQQKHGEIVKEVLQHGGRTFDEVEFSLF